MKDFAVARRCATSPGLSKVLLELLNFDGVALRAQDACLGRRTLVVFRSPAFNFDPVNTPRQQAAFGRHMRPIVEEAGMVYIDNYPATYDAVFQRTPHAIKFAKNSAFHYLNAGRYLMCQLLLHTLQLLAPSKATLLG